MFIKQVGQGPDLVLIHGWSLNSVVWQPLLARLQTQFTCHCVDLPGHGQSSWQANALQLDGLLNELARKLPQSAIWLGWSLGGQIALAMADRFPECVSRLILLAATPKFVASKAWPTAMPAETFAQFAASLQQDQRQTLKRFIALQAKGAEQSRETLDALTAAIQQHAADPLALRAGLDLLKTLDQRQVLKNLTLPVMCILGERDNLIPVSVGEAVNKLLPDAEIVTIPRAGHAPFIAYPELCSETIKKFCDV